MLRLGYCLPFDDLVLDSFRLTCIYFTFDCLTSYYNLNTSRAMTVSSVSLKVLRNLKIESESRL